MTGGPIEAVRELSAAFAARDLAAALQCFVPGDDVGYAGSELAERADGRDALTVLLAGVFQRDEAYVTGRVAERSCSWLINSRRSFGRQER